MCKIAILQINSNKHSWAIHNFIQKHKTLGFQFFQRQFAYGISTYKKQN